MAETLHASTDRHAEWGGTRRYIRIRVHDTTVELQDAAQAYRGDDFDWTGVAGCFHPAALRLRYDADGDMTDVSDPHYAGTLRLSREQMTTEAVVHECVHAAAAIYRMDVCADVRLGTGCGDREETLAYIAGDLTHSVSEALHSAGVWA